MKRYQVGGSVRDRFLGIEPHDLDYVLVGATVEDVAHMIEFGYKQVGADFPVFLHPDTGCEYALARTERKVGVGYNGFETFTSPELTIEDDLNRRDFTMNAMALDVDGVLVDPFNGQNDIKNRVIRHVSEAFSEDPLRVLRAARFAAQLGFTIAPETMVLMKEMVQRGDLDHLSRERVWVEIEKILNNKNTLKGIKVLRKLGALQRLFDSNFGDIDHVNREYLLDLGMYPEHFEDMNPISKFVILTKYVWFFQGSFEELKIPSIFIDATNLFNTNLFAVMNFLQGTPEHQYDTLNNLGLFGNKGLFKHIEDAFNLMVINFPVLYNYIAVALSYALSVDCARIAKECANGKEIGEKIKAARIFNISVWNNNRKRMSNVNSSTSVQSSSEG